MTEQLNEPKPIPYISQHPYEDGFVSQFVDVCEGHSLEDIARAVWEFMERRYDDWESDHSWN